MKETVDFLRNYYCVPPTMSLSDLPIPNFTWEKLIKLLERYSGQIDAEVMQARFLGVQNGGRKSKEYEALTIQALHQLNEIYDGNDKAFMDREQFIDTYLDGLGDYEKKIAKEQGIEIR